MKLARVGFHGVERPALIDTAGRLRSLANVIPDIDAAHLDPDQLAVLRELDTDALPLIEGSVRYGPPVVGTRKFLAVGLNYSDHAAEANLPVPAEPILFMKPTGCIAGANDDVPLPRGSTRMDWEIELGIVIGTRARYVEESAAMEHVAGYVMVNDLSERFDQLERGGTWDKGKGHDGFGPIGPWLVTTDELGEARDLAMMLDVSGVRQQTGNTSSMIFDVPRIVAYASRFMTLEPGDIIATGTPAGVGMGLTPPTYLGVGDTLRLSIDGLGEQRQRIVASI